MTKSFHVFIEHIIDSIEKIEEFTKNIGEDEFNKNTQLQDAVIRRIEIIGETVKNLPEDFRERHKNISWKEIIGTRDKIIHHYFGANLDIVWSIQKSKIILNLVITDFNNICLTK